MSDIEILPPATVVVGDQPRGRPFAPGTSGNPSGRPRGTRNATTMAMEVLLDGEAERLTRMAVERAFSGDPLALKFCLERILPARQRERAVTFELPAIGAAADVAKASGAVLAACAAGQLTPSEAAIVSGVIKCHVQALETTELEARMTAMERRSQDERG